MNKKKVAIIDYGLGNLLSVQRAFEYCGAYAVITTSEAEIMAADKVVLPGVGAFKNAMLALYKLGLVPILNNVVKREKSLMGICLGMQLLFEASEEFGENEGLGLIPGRIIPIPSTNIAGEFHKIPHVGWTNVEINLKQNDLSKKIFLGLKSNPDFYFVHSYMAKTSEEFIIATSNYGGHEILAVVGNGNIVGCQFHPEKSGDLGLNLLRNFCGY